MTLKFGEVVEQDPARSRVKVKLADQDGLVTWWLAVTSTGTGKDRFYAMPDIGEHVAVHMDERMEDGVVLGSIYSGPQPPPIDDPEVRQVVFGDGTVIYYDRANHRLQVELLPEGQIKFKVGRSEFIMQDESVEIITPRLIGKNAG